MSQCEVGGGKRVGGKEKGRERRRVGEKEEVVEDRERERQKHTGEQDMVLGRTHGTARCSELLNFCQCDSN